MSDHFADGMARIARSDNKLLVLAADQRASLRRMLVERRRPADDASLLGAKRDIVRVLSPAASGVLLDPEIGLPALADERAIDPAAGVLVSLERTDPPWHDGLRRSELLAGMTAEHARQIGADVAKLLVYLRPDQEAATAHAATLLEEAVGACEAARLALVVEVLVYPLPGEDETAYERSLAALVRDAASVAVGAGAGMLKLQYPGSAAGCRLVGDSLGVPWAMLSGGAPADVFCSQLTEALEAGACGCMAGRSVWSGSLGFDGPARVAYLADEGRRILDTLSSLLDAGGRGWDG